MNRLTLDQVAEFEKKHPRAKYFLERCHLINERKHLEINEYVLNDWQKNRLAELDQWHRDMVAMREI